MNDAKAFLDPSFGRETSATFASGFERTVRLRMELGLPYGLRLMVLVAVNGQGMSWKLERKRLPRSPTAEVRRGELVHRPGLAAGPDGLRDRCSAARVRDA
jgi:hypothetical protein